MQNTTGDEVVIRLRESDSWNDVVRISRTDERDLEMLFHRLNNSFIYHFRTGLRERAAPFLSFLRARAGEFKCQMSNLTVSDCPEETDYAFGDFLGNELKPQIYRTLV